MVVPPHGGPVSLRARRSTQAGGLVALLQAHSEPAGAKLLYPACDDWMGGDWKAPVRLRTGTPYRLRRKNLVNQTPYRVAIGKPCLGWNLQVRRPCPVRDRDHTETRVLLKGRLKPDFAVIYGSRLRPV